MSLIKNGNFTPWLRLVLAFAGLFTMYLSHQYLIEIWMYLGLLTGLSIGTVGAYAEKANTLGLKPFDNSYKKAKASYSKTDGKKKSEDNTDKNNP
jgi:hypothetical protein